MTTKIKTTLWIITGLIMTLAVNVAFAQEEAEVVESSTGSSIGIVIAILGLGVLVILGLGVAMNAQASEEQNA